MRPQFRKALMASDRFLLHKLPHHLHIELVEENAPDPSPNKLRVTRQTHVTRLMALGFSLALWCYGQRCCYGVGGCGENTIAFLRPTETQSTRIWTLEANANAKCDKKAKACMHQQHKLFFFVAPSRCEQYSFYCLATTECAARCCCDRCHSERTVSPLMLVNRMDGKQDTSCICSLQIIANHLRIKQWGQGEAMNAFCW